MCTRPFGRGASVILLGPTPEVRGGGVRDPEYWDVISSKQNVSSFVRVSPVPRPVCRRLSDSTLNSDSYGSRIEGQVFLLRPSSLSVLDPGFLQGGFRLRCLRFWSCRVSVDISPKVVSLLPSVDQRQVSRHWDPFDEWERLEV